MSESTEGSCEMTTACLKALKAAVRCKVFTRRETTAMSTYSDFYLDIIHDLNSVWSTGQTRLNVIDLI
ncbi:hypothetical protein J6590_027309 [Homalodisca vitripennis]|nr:hypothetical protein J6590_027309 [Homalodisca vitripennis]